MISDLARLERQLTSVLNYKWPSHSHTVRQSHSQTVTQSDSQTVRQLTSSTQAVTQSDSEDCRRWFFIYPTPVAVVLELVLPVSDK